MTTELAQKMWDANVRIEKMFWIAGCCAARPQDFEDFLEEDLADSKEVMAALPWLKGYIERGGMPEAEELLAGFAQKNVDGFFVQLATPIPTQFHKGSLAGGYSFSWGYYQTAWFFFPSLDAITERAVTWHEEVVERARKNSRKKKAA